MIQYTGRNMDELLKFTGAHEAEEDFSGDELVLQIEGNTTLKVKRGESVFTDGGQFYVSQGSQDVAIVAAANGAPSEDRFANDLLVLRVVAQEYEDSALACDVPSLQRFAVLRTERAAQLRSIADRYEVFANDRRAQKVAK